LNVLGLAIRNIRGSSFRSLVIFLCVMVVAMFFLSATLIIRGAENSLDVGLRRLGADIIVVPQGAESKIETALLMGKPTKIWMPEENLAKLASIPGVAAVSPQIYLSSLYGASCCAVSEMFLVVYDPATDFAISPWLRRNLGRGLTKGEVIGGTFVFIPPGEKDIKLYGYHLTLKGNLEPTGTGLDQTMFMTLETARDMAASSMTTAESPLQIPPGSISAALVKVSLGADRHKVALQVFRDVLGVVPIESPNLFGSFRQQITGVLWGFVVIMGIIWAISAVLIGLIFSMAVNERRREIAVLRALGATRNFVFRSILSEACLLALGAGVLGIGLAAFGVYLFRDLIALRLGLPFLFPGALSFLGLFGIGLALALGTVVLAAILPAFRISRQEAAVAMRE